MTPIRTPATQPGRIFRKVGYGPLLDVFFVDLRSYRGANQGEDGGVLFGWRQADWLKRELAASRAVWKVIACDMPIGLVVWDDYANRRGSMRSPTATMARLRGVNSSLQISSASSATMPSTISSG